MPNRNRTGTLPGLVIRQSAFFKNSFANRGPKLNLPCPLMAWQNWQVGQRFDVDGFKGSVQYIGKLPTGKNPDTVWCGVCWDDSTRGTVP